jgi:hypothetical protein
MIGGRLNHSLNNGSGSVESLYESADYDEIVREMIYTQTHDTRAVISTTK